MSCLSNLLDDLDDLGEMEPEMAHTMADAIRDLLREVGMQRDRITTATACSEACHALSQLMLSIELAEQVEASEQCIQGTTAKERRSMAIADIAS